MGRSQHELVTKSIPWIVITDDLGSAPDVTLSVPGSSGGGWVRRELLGKFFNVGKVFKKRLPNTPGVPGDIPNNICICPFVHGSSGADISGANIRFRVDSYRGPKNNLDRIISVSGTAGGYAMSAQDNGVAVQTSGRYCHFLNLTKNYGNRFSVYDGASDNGKAYVYGDNNGQANLAFSLISAPTGVKVGIAVTGW